MGQEDLDVARANCAINETAIMEGKGKGNHSWKFKSSVLEIDAS